MKRNSSFFRVVMACMVFAFTFVSTGMLGVMLTPGTAAATWLEDNYIRINASGHHADATGDNAIAIGDNAIASADNSVALGASSDAEEEWTVSVGNSSKQRRIVNVAAGSASNDAVTLGQLADGTNISQIKVGGITISSADNSISGVSALTATGTITGNSIVSTGTISATGTISTSGDITADGDITATGNITGKYLKVNSDANAATATGNGAVALGGSATATGAYSTALGDGATATGDSSVALGDGAKAISFYSAALGDGATASGLFSTALGAASTASADHAVAIGVGSYTDEKDTVSVGSGGNDIYGIGASEYRRIINVEAASNDHDAVTLGQLKDGTNLSQLKVGGITISSADNSISGVSTLTATGNISTSGDITADGNITGKYLKVNSNADAATASGTNSTALGPAATASGTNSTALGPAANASGNYSTALGPTANASGNYSTALGPLATASGTNSTALGFNAKASGLSSTALGRSATASADKAVAIGYGSYTDEQDTVSVGNSTTQRRIINVKAASNDHDAVNYSQLKALSGDLSTSIGTVTTNLDTVSNDVATVSSDLKGLDDIAVKYTDDSRNTVSFGNATPVMMTVGDGVLTFSKSGGGDVKLSGIADGTNANDAVNFGQLSALQAQVTSISSDLYNQSDGIQQKTIQLETVTNTISADVTQAKQDITQAQQDIDTIEEKTDNITVENDGKIKISNLAEGTANNDAVNKKQLVQDGGMYIEPTQTTSAATKTLTTAVIVTDANADSVQVTALKAGENLTLTNDSGKGVYALSKNLTNLESVAVGGVKIDGTTNKITGIADGGIYSGSTEAVNGGQLYNAYSVMGSMQENINRLDQNIGYVGAHAAAMSALHAVPYNGSSRTTFTAGFGNYRGEQGYALGVFHYLSENVLANAAMSYNTGGDVMSRAGISFALGNGGHKKVSKAVCTEMEKKLAEQEQVIIELQNDKAEQSKQLAAQDEKLTALESEKAEQNSKISQLMKTVELLNKRLSAVEKKKK